MFEHIKESLAEVIAIADSCPDQYQVKCFEVLLDHLAGPRTSDNTDMRATAPGLTAEILSGTQHPFFAQHEISEEEWTRVYHSEDNEYHIIVGNLKEKTTSRQQIRLGLLLGVKNLLESGEALVPRDSLVDSCKNYSVFDSSNFSTNMKKQKTYFLAKGKNEWVLTIPGQRAAAEAIKELGQ